MPSFPITLAAQNPPDGPVVLIPRPGGGKVHFPNESRDGTRCGLKLDGLVSGWMWEEVEDHSDLCKNCLRKYE